MVFISSHQLSRILKDRLASRIVQHLRDMRHNPVLGISGPHTPCSPPVGVPEAERCPESALKEALKGLSSSLMSAKSRRAPTLISVFSFCFSTGST